MTAPSREEQEEAILTQFVEDLFSHNPREQTTESDPVFNLNNLGKTIAMRQFLKVLHHQKATFADSLLDYLLAILSNLTIKTFP